ncbi:MAG TPA: metallophosphoesterase [Anaerolineae bacterium]|jgi:3',5'-cyclic AMP phosphodiesterase CpdA|nr:metallophosphoesterase [Anaerolineae bacterium]
METGLYRIAQISDLHCGDARFDEGLMLSAVHEINEANPKIAVICGDLTTGGYLDEFEQAKSYIDMIECPIKVVIAGNHDHRNLGYLYFESIFGARYKTLDLQFGMPSIGNFQERIKFVAVDSSKPDLNDGEVGREHYDWLREEFNVEHSFKVFILHHHLVSVPGTGRERNIVWDAGDVLARLRGAGVDLVLCGHKHVPYVWPVSNMLLINSGTVSTYRTRGYTEPSYNIIDIMPEEVLVVTKKPGEEFTQEWSFTRYPVF